MCIGCTTGVYHRVYIGRIQQGSLPWVYIGCIQQSSLPSMVGIPGWVYSLPPYHGGICLPVYIPTYTTLGTPTMLHPVLRTVSAVQGVVQRPAVRVLGSEGEKPVGGSLRREERVLKV